LVAFVVQSLIAVIVSFYAWILSSKIQQRWNDADPNARRIHLLDDKAKDWLQSFSIVRILQKAYHKYLQFHQLLGKREDNPSDGLAWLIGKQPQHPRQRNSESRIEDEITPTTRRLDCANKILLAGSDSQSFAGKLNSRWSLFSIYTVTLPGIALLISALIQSKTLTFYHMHIIYDTISLVM
jgi:hypothetical protein